MLIKNILSNLVDNNALTSDAATTALAQPMPLGWLIRQQLVDANLLAQILSKTLYLPYLDLDKLDDTSFVLNVLPEIFIRDNYILPFNINSDSACIALADPSRASILQEISFRLGVEIHWHIVDYDKLAKRLAQLLRLQAQENLTDDAPIVRYVEKLLLNAVNKNASDIHIEHDAKQMRIRFRIDGILYDIAKLSQQLAPRLIAHLKVLAQLDITERRLPQDGRLQINLSAHKKIDCRLSSCPTVYGEKIVLRLLNNNLLNLDINNLGFSQKHQLLFLDAIQQPQGMILVTGPTGSGKTVTLYTALNILNKNTVNICSVEDPVEIELPGINQVAVNSKIELNFAKILRAFLRQDPDIIMVGEMRDTETADIAIKAAQTGHLVLSTLHTNSAAETITRLLNMGLPAYHLAASLRLIIAQRLVRCLCVFCKRKEKTEDGENYIPIGCAKCQEGYLGRTAIYELLPISKNIIQLLLRDNNAIALEKLAIQEGMQTLYQHGLEKVRLGITSINELRRVIH